MAKKFNTQGTCIPEKHFMVDISKKLEKIIEMIDDELYFIINRPRQYGKTTTMYLLERILNNEYDILPLSFEGMGDERYLSEESFIEGLFLQLNKLFEYTNNQTLKKIIEEHIKLTKLDQLSEFITKLVIKSPKKVILMIDEVDKSCNNQLFLNFLGMLRNKYLLRSAGRDNTFHSVILAGVHDVKTLKLKLRNDEEQKYNSPWNIATEFEVDMSFSDEEISTMLVDYAKEKNIKMDIKEISEKLYYYTSGYPFLVSRLCELIDKKIMKENNWSLEDVDSAVKLILNESNANFDEVIKNLENNEKLHDTVQEIIIHGNEKTFNIHNPVINIGIIFGIFKKLILPTGSSGSDHRTGVPVGFCTVHG